MSFVNKEDIHSCNITTLQLEFAPINRKKVTALFDEPRVSSDAGVLYLREVDRRIGMTDRIVDAMIDPRRQTHIRHHLHELLRQRSYQIGCGYEDADDCDHLKSDPAFKVGVGRDPQNDPDLASQPTMSRLENMVTVRELLRIGYVFIDQFIASYESAPKVIVLDMDPTADITYGHQQLTLFNAYEDEYCFMPFHVYEGLSGKLIATVLRSGKTPKAEEIISVLKRIVSRIRRAWPEVLIIFRADSHHTKPKVMEWMEPRGVEYATGLCANAVLDKLFAPTIQDAEKKHQRWGGVVRAYGSAYYAAESWNGKERRVICRVLVSAKGTDVRYIVTSFTQAGAKYLCELVYCGRGAMELMIKDHKVGLKSDRTSCTRKEANQFRLFLHSAAYVLMYTLRDQLLKGSELARAQFDTIRLRLLKLGARVDIAKTFIRFHLPASYPLQPLLIRASTLLAAVPISP
ncbi:MAG: IS1380 family transposase [Candidatus Aureabacteria bacterium]|nr:IS1380 family transposase [Candidatus Auribacterota bacterium]